MLHDPARHEPLIPLAWNDEAARAAIQHIVARTETSYRGARYWPVHPLDREGIAPDPVETPLYHGAAGVTWALQYLGDRGAAKLAQDWLDGWRDLLEANRGWLAANAPGEQASWLMGDTPILMMALPRHPELAGELARLVAANRTHPARELMWGAPGTLLAALFLHERTGEAHWAALFRETAATLWEQLAWSEQHGCAYWVQDLYGRESSYLDAVHGFVATAAPLIKGRYLLDAADWQRWQDCIANTVRKSAVIEGGQVSWNPQLFGTERENAKKLLQFCHGAPGFVIALSDFPGDELDDLLLCAGEATWAAGPLRKGSNLCHGTAGNGYAFLVLYRRTGEPVWLERARAFAMHALKQFERDAQDYGQLRYSLWTGDLGLAIYLWDCIRARPQFPTLDVFYAQKFLEGQDREALEEAGDGDQSAQGAEHDPARQRSLGCLVHGSSP
jgi:hypothetical protein